jgi:hypothetical protein
MLCAIAQVYGEAVHWNWWELAKRGSMASIERGLSMRGKRLFFLFAGVGLMGCLAAGGSQQPEVKPVVVTLTGTAAGEDSGIFGVSDLNDQPFTLSFSFDGGGAQLGGSSECPATSAVVRGAAPNSHATAILTIGSASYTFGSKANSRWQASRYLKSPCGNDGLFALHIDESVGGSMSGIDVRVSPKQSARPVITSLDWHSALNNVTEIDQSPSCCNFLIMDPHNPSKYAKGSLFLKTVTVR